MPSAFEADHEVDMADPVYVDEYHAMVRHIAEVVDLMLGPYNCRKGCETRDHVTWGDCVRDANIAVDRTALASGREG